MPAEGAKPDVGALQDFGRVLRTVHRLKKLARGQTLVFLKTLIFTIFIPGLMTAGFPYLVLQTRETATPPDFGGILGGTGSLLVLIGMAIYFWTAFDFADTGQGTPFPLDPPKAVVRRGLYRFVRNPMYLGIMAVILGESALWRAFELVEYFGSVLAGFVLFVRFYEEPSLKRRFGPSYEEYCRQVPRWLPAFRSKLPARRQPPAEPALENRLQELRNKP
jgi:protein-S-isoprenylcysteine O-methyltransferase Ste14